METEDSRLGDSFSFGWDQGWPFFSSGLTAAVFNSNGTPPDRINPFMVFVKAGRRRSLFSQRSDVDSGSNSQVFCAIFLRMLCTSFSDTDEN